MKIIQINVLGKTCSTGRTTWELHEYLVKQGFDSRIVTATGIDCEDSIHVTNKLGIYVDKAVSILSGLEGYSSIIPTLKLLQFLNTQKPDVVHLRNLHESYVNLGMLLNYLAKKNIATVVSLHDFWFFTGKCCSPDRYNCQKWCSGCGNCPALKFDQRKRMFDRTSKMWEDKKKWFSQINRLAIVGNSKWATSNGNQSFLKVAPIKETIYNWIDQSVFYPRDTALFRERYGLVGKKVILGVSSFWAVKGGKGFVDYIRLSKKIPSDWIIVLIGKTNEECSGNERLMMIPSTTSCDELATWYSAADVYLNISESETFGKAAAEAVCCGTPIVALNRTANPEIVPDGAGYIIDTVETEEIKSTMDTLFSKPKSHYTKTCVDFARKNFDKKNNMESFVRVYERLIRM